MLRRLSLPIAVVIASLFPETFCIAEEEKPETKTVTIADDLEGKVPADWKTVKPDFPRFRKHQFVLPRAKDDSADGVLIVYHFGKGGGGSLEDNLDRWYGMVEQPDGESSKKAGKIEQIESGQGDAKIEITWLDLPGTYLDKPFPRSPKVTRRENYRLFAAYVDGGEEGPYWIRGYGPDATMLEARDGFVSFLKSLHGK